MSLNRFAVKKSKTPEEINKIIIDNLGGSMEVHLKDKHLYHEKDLPFYTCVDGDSWTKEFPNGEIHLVHREINLETFEKTEIFIRQLTPATKVATSATKTHSVKIRWKNSYR